MSLHWMDDSIWCILHLYVLPRGSSCVMAIQRECLWQETRKRDPKKINSLFFYSPMGVEIIVIGSFSSLKPMPLIMDQTTCTTNQVEKTLIIFFFPIINNDTFYLYTLWQNSKVCSKMKKKLLLQKVNKQLTFVKNVKK